LFAHVENYRNVFCYKKRTMFNSFLIYAIILILKSAEFT